MSQKILSAHCGGRELKAGELILVNVDRVLGNDITTPVAVGEFDRLGHTSVFDREGVVLVMDHFTPNKDIKSAEQCLCVRNFAHKYDIENFFDVGEMGIEHALVPERGLVTAGDVFIGADSHTCTYGALGAFSTGVGSTDMACGMATGKVWFKVPSAIRFNLSGRLPQGVYGKDLILHIIGMISVSGALYQSMEFTGEGLASISMDERLCIANMGIEAGAKNAIFEVDDITLTYLMEHGARSPRVHKADADAEYTAQYDINLSEIRPVVSCPHSPDNVKPACELSHIEIHQAVIGSCTNGRISDLKAAADVLKGKKVKKSVRVIIIPATQLIYLEALRLGYIETFIESGCVVSTPTCGPCLGGHMGILAQGERCIATTNRNFIGRMGHTGSEVYLASPAVAAYSAINGYISDK